jgi:hypothetical protein
LAAPSLGQRLLFGLSGTHKERKTAQCHPITASSSLISASAQIGRENPVSASPPQREAVMSYLDGGRWALVDEFTEVESGKRNDRPELVKALAACKKQKAKLVIAKARPPVP